ncbi:MAG TPA: hypothetical protein PKV72_05305 [Candidatus Peribacteria bacterium]|nr:hypothetical protein [Candidatus Peribacteria bacterium]
MKTRTVELWFFFAVIAMAALMIVSYTLAWEAVYTVAPFYFVLLCPVILSVVAHDRRDGNWLSRHSGRIHHQSH